LDKKPPHGMMEALAVTVSDFASEKRTHSKLLK
jgi:hypothetical protein